MSYAETSANGIAILLWSADMHQPEKLATPFFHATAAGAMDAEVEIYFSASSVRLLLPGLARKLKASSKVDKTIADNMHEALDMGARFYVCSDALHAQGLTLQELMPDCKIGGAVQFMARALDLKWRTLIF